MSSIRTILILLLVLGAVEGMAYWWMHPAPAGLGDPVLVYRPGGGGEGESGREGDGGRGTEDGGQKTEDGGRGTGDRDQAAGDRGQEEATAPALDPAQSTSSTDHRSLLTDHSSPSSLTPLPEIASRAIPVLRCSTGTAARIDRDDGVTVHIAFFEWNLADSNNVLEAFKHLPDECMGSLGMTLTAKHPPRTYVVRGRDRGQGTGDSGQEEAAAPALDPAQSTSSTDHRSLLTDHSPSSETLSFDHTTFLDPAGVVVHAFKGTWVSGAADLLGPNVRGGADQWRQIRWKSALKRFNPAHARVAQGAVRGIPNPERAWQIFEETMLVDLKVER